MQKENPIGQTTTFWNPDCPIAQAAQANVVRLDWINASKKVEKLRCKLADAEREAQVCFQIYVNLRGAKNG